ncbi:MAG: hypothetical protein E7630_05990, partial [Ruminococcaceae bacterium]|nr:hypothetical protein [Oscillospiraceae bacterium]
MLLVVFCVVGLTACGGCSHQWGDWTATTQATCTEAGAQERKCSKCGEIETSAIEALGHDWAEATCLAPKTCKTCSLTEGAALTDHAYTVEAVKDEALKSAATEESAAVYYKSCVCGAISTNDADTFTSGSPLEHVHGFTLETVKTEALKTPATCEKAAVYFRSCACGAISTSGADTFTNGAALGHKDEDHNHVCDNKCGKKNMGTHADSKKDDDHLCDYGCGVAIEKCSDAEGDDDHACDVCGKENVTAHDFGDATCGTLATCPECGLTTDETGNHVFNQSVVKAEALKSAATCDSPAVYFKSCTCGAISTAEADVFTDGDALEHKDENHDHLCDLGCGKDDMGDHADSPTDDDHVCDYGCGATLEDCADAENDGDHVCDVCDKADVSSHQYGDATCETPATCSECGGTTGRELGHKDEDKDHVCDRECGKTDVGTHADSATDNDHVCDYGCGAVLEECTDSATDDDHVCDNGCGAVLEDCADAENDGDHSCDVCGKADLTDHSYGDATCEAPATCSECGGTTGEALGHEDEDKDHVCDNECGK